MTDKKLPYDFDLVFDIKSEEELWEKYKQIRDEYFSMRELMFDYGYLRRF